MLCMIRYIHVHIYMYIYILIRYIIITLQWTVTMINTIES